MNDEERLAKERLERFIAKVLHIVEVPVPRGYRGCLLDEQLLEGVVTISQNAEELLSDARLLFENGRYARAASLAVLALEESFKRLMLFMYPLIREDRQGQKEFWKVWRDHKVKSSTPATAPFLLGQIDKARRAELTEVLGRWAVALKQRGLYADCCESSGEPAWSLPSAAVDEAQTAIEMAAAFSGPLSEEDARWMLACAGSSHDALETLLVLADGMEGFTGARDLGALAEAPANIRGFVESTLRSIAEEPKEPGDAG